MCWSCANCLGRPLSNRIAVLGIGPSGLAVAVAALKAGYPVDLYTKRFVKSQLFGCQYLHAPIEGYTIGSPVIVDYRLVGSIADYRRKVYGDRWSGSVSPGDFEEQHNAWDIRDTYDRMWDVIMGSYDVRVIKADLDALSFSNTVNPNSYLQIISTIPAWHLCGYEGHKFRSRTVWAAGSREAVEPARKAEIICDGTEGVSWYRSAEVFGYRTTEWATNPAEDETNAVRVEKPLSTNCDCFPHIIRMGRYGRYAKGILVHQVYEQATYLMRLLNGTASPDIHICRTCGRWGEGSTNGLVWRCTEGHIWSA